MINLNFVLSFLTELRRLTRSFPVVEPEELESQKGEPSAHSWMKSAESQYLSLFGGDLKAELFKSLGQDAIEPVRIVPVPKSAYEIIGKAIDDCFHSTMRLHNLLEP